MRLVTIAAIFGSFVALSGVSSAVNIVGRCNNNDYYRHNAHWCDALSINRPSAVHKANRIPRDAYAAVEQRPFITVYRDHQHSNDDQFSDHFIVLQTADDVARGKFQHQSGWLLSARDLYMKHPGATAVAARRQPGIAVR